MTSRSSLRRAEKLKVLVQISDWDPVGRVCLVDQEYSAYATRAAGQISGIVAVGPQSLPILNCPFLIFSANLIPLMTTAAVLKLFSPSIGPSRCFTRRWSCSMVLFRCLLLRCRSPKMRPQA